MPKTPSQEVFGCLGHITHSKTHGPLIWPNWNISQTSISLKSEDSPNQTTIWGPRSCEAAIIWPDLWSVLSYFLGFTSPTKSQKPMDSHFHSCVISGEPPGLRGKDRHLKGRLRRGFQQSTLDSASQCLRISNFWPPKKTLPNTVDGTEIPNNHLGCKIPCTKHYETW